MIVDVGTLSRPGKDVLLSVQSLIDFLLRHLDDQTKQPQLPMPGPMPIQQRRDGPPLGLVALRAVVFLEGICQDCGTSLPVIRVSQ